MAQASSVLSVPISELIRAKSAGCPAFRGSRVYADVVEWLKDNPMPEGTEVEAGSAANRLKEAQIRKLDLEDAIKRGEYILRSEAKCDWEKALSLIQAVMKSYLTVADYNVAIKQMKAGLSDVADP